MFAKRITNNCAKMLGKPHFVLLSSVLFLGFHLAHRQGFKGGKVRLRTGVGQSGLPLPGKDAEPMPSQWHVRAVLLHQKSRISNSCTR